MAESFFVQDDGYTLKGKLPGRPGVYPPSEFQYRAATRTVRLKYQEAYGQIAKDQAGAEIISYGVNDLRKEGDAPGSGIRLMPDQVKTLHAELAEGLLNYALGYASPTTDQMEKNSNTPSGSG